MLPTQPPSKHKLELPRGGTSVLKRCNLGGKESIAAEFELLRKNLERRAELTSPHAVLTLSTGRSLPHSDNLGGISDTGRVGGTVPYPALERGVKKVISGNPFSGSTIIYRVYTYIHTSGTYFIRLRWMLIEIYRSTTGARTDTIHDRLIKTMIRKEYRCSHNLENKSFI